MEPSEQQAVLARARQIDDYCNRFEAQWKAGKAAQLEGVLKSCPESLRPELLRALLPVELELLGRGGRQVSEADYRSRFPGDAEVIREIFVRIADQAARDTSVNQASAQMEGAVGGPHTGPYVAAATAGAPSAAPRKIGRFEIMAVLGEGAFGKVYRARDPKLDREVALKVPSPTAQPQQHIEHPAAVGAHRHGRAKQDLSRSGNDGVWAQRLAEWARSCSSDTRSVRRPWRGR